MDNLTDTLQDLGLTVAFETDDRVVCECPLTEHEHDHVRPGFSARKDDGRWICFKGCGMGSLAQLAMRVHNLSPSDADRWVLLHGGHVDSAQLLDHLDSTKPQGKVSVSPHVFWEDYNRQSATKTSRYIFDRGFTVDTLKSWGLRYDSEVPAIVIPMFSLDGELIGIARREVVDGAQPRKYMYSPGAQTDKHLFGANMHTFHSGRAVLVEGILDCIWLHQCGITDAVALLGSRCSLTQQRLLTRLGARVVLALDADAAGFRAAKSIESQLAPWFNVERVVVPEPYKDVQEMPEDQVKELING